MKECPKSSLLFNIILKVLTTIIRQEKKIIGIKIINIDKNDMIAYVLKKIYKITIRTVVSITASQNMRSIPKEINCIAL